MPFVPYIAPPPGPARPAWWFLFHGDRLLVKVGEEGGIAIPLWEDPAEAGLKPVRTQYLGESEGVPCRSGELAEPVGPAGTAFRPLRPLLGALPEPLFFLAGRAFQIMDWDRTHLYCGKCGSPTEVLDGERAKACPSCGMHFFPRVAPAVIVAVVRDRKILLAHARRFPSTFYSVLAGFVEPGETLEECVRREVREETGLEVGNIRYFGSQPWPFPHNLMVAFTADYAGGELVLEEKEIVEAGWFGPGEIPGLPIPRPETIARRLIDWFLAGRC
jgi:NAD+ diphosphatase